MSEAFSSALPSAISQALQAYLEQGRPGARSYLEQTLDPARADVILDMLQRIQAGDAAVKQARELGLRPSQWLSEAFSDDAGRSILSEVPGLSQAAERAPTEVARHLMDLGTLALGEGFGEVAGTVLDAATTVTGPVQELVDTFFTSGLGAPIEQELSAVASGAAASLAERVGMAAALPGLVASIDLGFRVAKVGYLQATDQLDGIDQAAELIEDRVAANFAAMAGQAAEEGLATVGAGLGHLIDTHFHTMGLARQIGGELGRWAGREVRPWVEKGVYQLGRTVMKKARGVVRRLGGEALRSATRFARSLFG